MFSPISGHAVARERRQPGQFLLKLRERRWLSRGSCPEYHPTADRITSCSLPPTPGQGRPHRGAREGISSVQQLRHCQPGEWQCSRESRLREQGDCRGTVPQPRAHYPDSWLRQLPGSSTKLEGSFVRCLEWRLVSQGNEAWSALQMQQAAWRLGPQAVE